MNYNRAKIKAQMSATASGMDYAILKNGINYDYVLAKRLKGEAYEMIYPEKATDITSDVEEVVIEKPKKVVRKA
jgi:hypothetical protein